MNCCPERFKNAVKSLETLGSILEEDFSIIVRDATMQRFKYTFEAVWKFLKEYLKEKEGVISNSPKACFRKIFSLGFLSEDDATACLEMTDRRNDTSHTYKEEVAQIIYGKTRDYFLLMQTLISKFADKI
ncbi:MAG: nucleotidyltransferase substrate binding protein [Candidatus Omnitrophica bacterium]|nr:nucleotidyltransferase substrate binding protein [Candidatus Omnitrophota bacterium]